MKVCAMSSMGAAKRRTCCRQTEDIRHTAAAWTTARMSRGLPQRDGQTSMSRLHLFSPARVGAQRWVEGRSQLPVALRGGVAACRPNLHWCMIPQTVTVAAACCTGHVWTLQQRGNSLPQRPLRRPFKTILLSAQSGQTFMSSCCGGMISKAAQKVRGHLLTWAALRGGLHGCARSRQPLDSAAPPLPLQAHAEQLRRQGVQELKGQQNNHIDNSERLCSRLLARFCKTSSACKGWQQRRGLAWTGRAPAHERDLGRTTEGLAPATWSQPHDK